MFEVFMRESVTGQTGQTAFQKEKHVTSEVSRSLYIQINLSA